MEVMQNEGDHDFNINHKDEDSNSLYNRSRGSFVKKVYSIISVQLLITTLFVIINIKVPQFAAFQANYIAPLIIFMIASIAISLVLVCVPSVSKNFPINMALLGLFTIAESYMVSYICSFYTPESVLGAAAATLGATVGLTLFAFTTKKDFTGCSYFMSAFFTSLLFIVMAVSLVNAFIIKSQPLSLAISVLLACVYSIYLIIDTQLILGGRHKELTFDNYVLGAMMIYIDVIGLFVQILKIIGAKKN